MTQGERGQMRAFIASKGGRLVCDECGSPATDYDEEAIAFVCGGHREINQLKRRIERLQTQIDKKLGRK